MVDEFNDRVFGVYSSLSGFRNLRCGNFIVARWRYLFWNGSAIATDLDVCHAHQYFCCGVVYSTMEWLVAKSGKFGDDDGGLYCFSIVCLGYTGTNDVHDSTHAYCSLSNSAREGTVANHLSVFTRWYVDIK